MRSIIWSFALAVFALPAAFGQAFSFSDPAPLTDTRYVAYRAGARLATSGTLPYLLWTAEGKARITPGTPLRRVGRPVLDVYTADAVWTGTQFVVVGLGVDGQLVRRRVGADGEAIGEPATILTGAPAGPVRLSFDGARVLVLFGGAPLQSMLLSRDGMPLGAPQSVPVDVPIVLSFSVAARSGTFIVTVVGEHHLATATLTGSAWTSALFAMPEFDRRAVAVAASPTTTLTLWTNGAGPIEGTTTRVDRPGQITSYTLAETNDAKAVAVSWDGQDFVYAYRIGTRIHFRYFNAPFPFASVDASPDSAIALVSTNGRTHAAWDAIGGTNPVIVRDVATLAGDAGAFGAATQWLQSSASSATSALFVWFEADGLHAGVRTATGNWSERPIPNAEEQAWLTASDGSGFVIIHASPSEPPNLTGWTSTLLDADGRILGNGPRVPFYPTGITWTGTAYAVVGLNASQQVVGTLLSPAGTVTAPAVLALPRAGRLTDHPRITSRGNELLVVWADYRDFACFPPCSGFESDVLGARFTPTLQRVDTQSLLLATEDAVFPDAVWDGTRYMISWSKNGAIQYRSLRTNSAVSGITTIAGARAEDPHLVLVPGGAAALADDGKVALLRDGGDIVMKLGENGTQALAMTGGRLAYVQGVTRDEMPYHGATRLNIRVGDLVAPAPKPSSPQITLAVLTQDRMAMIVEWTAPAEPVNGYRVEYRVDDGVWNELDEWFDARTTRLTIRPWRSDVVRYQFRVRAVNDAGFSAYSGPATVRPRKMRAVR